MIRRAGGIAVCAAWLVAGSAAGAVVDVAAGVFAVVQAHEQRFDDANVVVVSGRDATLIVDAPASRATIDEVVAAIRERGLAPVRWVVNTHWHGDHTQGNALYRAAFGEQVVFVGHRSLKDEIPGRAAPALRERVERMTEMIPRAEAALAEGKGLRGQELDAEQRAAQAVSIEETRAWVEQNHAVEFVVPQLAYGDELALDLGGLEVRLLHRRAHTAGDTLVWIPDREVLASGDVLDDLPYIGHGYPRSWIAALDAIAALPFKRIVPGHGPLFEDGREQLDRVRGFLQALVAHADSAAASFDAAPWRERLARGDAAAERFFDAVLDEALARAAAENE